jgi:hypothetical protein
MNTSQETRGGRGQHYPLSNLEYDLITVIAEKSKALEAIGQYMQDAQGNQQAMQLFQKIQQDDTQCIQEAMQCLQQVKSGSGAR